MNTDKLTERYENDPVFHQMVQKIVSSVQDGRLERIDWFDAIRMADRILFMRESTRPSEREIIAAP